MSRLAAVAAAAVLSGGLVLGPEAAARVPDVALSAAAGYFALTTDGALVEKGRIAECRASGRRADEAPGARIGGTTFGQAESQCLRGADGVATALGRGQGFETQVLRKFGGPTIRVGSYSARCDITADHATTGAVRLDDVTGVALPGGDIPANHTVLVPGESGKPLARVVLNELVQPTPPDGSLTVRALHIHLFPDGGPAAGDIVAGSASCDPDFD